MTALPERPPQPMLSSDLMTVADYVALGEPPSGYTELQEGHLLMSPSPTVRHNVASGWLWSQLTAQLPSGLLAVQDVDVDLQLAPPDQPGSSRRPDLVVVDRSAVDRVDHEGGMLLAKEVR